MNPNLQKLPSANNPKEGRANAYAYILQLIDASGIKLEQCGSRAELKQKFAELLEALILKEGADVYGLIGKEKIEADDEYRKTVIQTLLNEYWSIIEPAIEESNGTIQINENALTGSLQKVDPAKNPTTGIPVVDNFLKHNLLGLREELETYRPGRLSKPKDVKIFLSSAFAVLGTTAFTVVFSQRTMRDLLNNTYLQLDSSSFLRQITEDPIARDAISWGFGCLTAGAMIAVISKMQRTLASETKGRFEKNAWTLLAFLSAFTGMAFDAKGSLADKASGYHLAGQQADISSAVEGALIGDSTPLAQYANMVETDTYRLEKQLENYSKEEELRPGRSGQGPLWAGKTAMTTGSLPTPSLGADGETFQTIKTAHSSLDLTLKTHHNPLIRKTYDFLILKGGEYGIDEFYAGIQKSLNGEIEAKKAEIQVKIESLEGADVIKTDQIRLAILEDIKDLTRITSEHEDAMLEVALVYSSYKEQISKIAINTYGQELPLDPKLEIESLDMAELEEALNIPIEKLEPQDFMGYIDIVKNLNPEGADKDFIEIFGRVLLIDFGAIVFLAISTLSRKKSKVKPLAEREADLAKYKKTLIKHFHAKLNDPILFRLIPNYTGFTERECGFLLDKTLEQLVSTLDTDNSTAQRIEKTKLAVGALVGEDSTPEDRRLLYTNKALRLMLDQHGKLKAETMHNLLLKLGLTGGNFGELETKHRHAKATLEEEMEERDVRIAREREGEFRSEIKRLSEADLMELVKDIKANWPTKKLIFESNPKNAEIVAEALKALNLLLKLTSEYLDLMDKCKDPNHLIKEYEIQKLKDLCQEIIDANETLWEKLTEMSKKHIETPLNNLSTIQDGLEEIDTWQICYDELSDRIIAFQASKSEYNGYNEKNFLDNDVKEITPKLQALADEFKAIKAKYTEAKKRLETLKSRLDQFDKDNQKLTDLSIKYSRLPQEVKDELGLNIGNYAFAHENLKRFMDSNALPSQDKFNQITAQLNELTTLKRLLLENENLINSKTLAEEGKQALTSQAPQGTTDVSVEEERTDDEVSYNE